MVSLKDVAEIAGVSIATASLAMNNKPQVAEATRLRVQAVAEKLNYVHNANARNLVTGLSRTIGLVVTGVNVPYFAQIVDTIEQELASVDRNLILALSREEEEQELQALADMRALRVNGIIMASISGSPKTRAILGIMQKQGVAVSLIGRVYPDNEFDSVVVDHIGGSAQVVDHLWQQGHRRIGIILPPRRLPTFRDRLRGWRLRVQDLGGTPPDDNLVRYGKPEKLDAIIDSYLGLRHPPTAIYATSDSLALAAYKSLTKMGIRIPKDMALVGMDNDDWTSALTPALSVLEQPVAEMARVATQNLLRRLNGANDGEPWQLVLTPRLLVRESSEEIAVERSEHYRSVSRSESGSLKR